MNQNKIYFSDYFEIDTSIVKGYGALDISLLNDLPLFIDPFLIFCSQDPTCRAMHDEIIKYLVYLRDRAKRKETPSKAELKYLFCFPEVKQNYLGFCQHGNFGSGLGTDFGRALYYGLKDIFQDFGEEQITKGHHIEKVCLLKEGVGKDNISDFITNLIKPFLLSYTEQFAKRYLRKEQCATFNISRARFDYDYEVWRSEPYYLPKHNDDYVLLTPTNLLVRDDIWINRANMIHDFNIFAESIPDEVLRDRVNAYFNQVLARESMQKDREKAAELTIREFPELIDYYIRYREDHDAEALAQSISEVTGVEQVFIKQVIQLVDELKEKTAFYQVRATNAFDEALERVKYLKHVIEDCDGYRYFYDGETPIHRESDLHIMYRLVSYDTISDVNSEVNNGRGAVDFKYSRGRKDKVLIEFKLARTLKRNLEKQVAVYQAADEQPPAITVILFFSDDEMKKVNKILNDLGLQGKAGIVVIDARNNKVQASKA